LRKGSDKNERKKTDTIVKAERYSGSFKNDNRTEFLPDLPPSGPQDGPEIQKIYLGTVRIWILTQFGEDFMKKSWNEVELNQRPGCPPAALLF
jgi:hypothetical protein